MNRIAIVRFIRVVAALFVQVVIGARWVNTWPPSVLVSYSRRSRGLELRVCAQIDVDVEPGNYLDGAGKFVRRTGNFIGQTEMFSVYTGNR